MTIQEVSVLNLFKKIFKSNIFLILSVAVLFFAGCFSFVVFNNNHSVSTPIVSASVTQSPIVYLTANGERNILSTGYGNPVILSWTTLNQPTACAATDEWSGAKNFLGGTMNIGVIPIGTHKYTISCSNRFGAISDSVTIEVCEGENPTTIIPVEGTFEADFQITIGTSTTNASSTDSSTSTATSTPTATTTATSSLPSTSNGTGSSGGSGASGGGFSPVIFSEKVENASVASSSQSVADCNYISTFMQKGWDNDPAEVIKLQTFLRDHEGFSNLQPTGEFDDPTFNAVSDFQLKYKNEILEPWGNNIPTGFVYILTVKKINEIYCKTNIALTGGQQAEIDNYRKTYHSVEMAGYNKSSQTSAVLETGETNTSSGEDLTSVPKVELEPETGDVENGWMKNVFQSEKTGNGRLQNLASLIFAFPESLSELFRYVFLFVFILFIIYVMSNILVDDGLTPDITKSKRTMYAIVGVLISIILAIIMKLYLLIAPFLLVTIILAVYLIWVINRTPRE